MGAHEFEMNITTQGCLTLTVLFAGFVAGAVAAEDLATERASNHSGSQLQLFVDDWIVAERTGLTRELGRVTKANGGRPIFTDGWFYGTVLRDKGRFKLW